MLPAGAHCLGKIVHSRIGDCNYRDALAADYLRGKTTYSHKICSVFFQLVMEYCLGSASDLLEGKLKAFTALIMQKATSFPAYPYYLILD